MLHALSQLRQHMRCNMFDLVLQYHALGWSNRSNLIQVLLVRNWVNTLCRYLHCLLLGGAVCRHVLYQATCLFLALVNVICFDEQFAKLVIPLCLEEK
jgi:hypothetical protein